MKSLSAFDNVYLGQVRLFFGNAASNAISVLIAAVVLASVLFSAGVSASIIVIWAWALFVLVAVLLYIESIFKKTELTINNAKKWLIARIVPGLALGSLYGISPFLLPSNTPIEYEFFIFIVLSGVVAVASISYSIMPFYYLALNAITLVPLTLYFAMRPDTMHAVMCFSSIVWQAALLKNAWAASKTSIRVVYLNERFQVEIAEHKRTREQLEVLVRHDSLTGLPNRKLLMETLSNMIAQSGRYGQNISIMFIDLDDFKQVNDNFGHGSGDVVLREVAKKLRSFVRDSDVVARLSGDEFILCYMESHDQRSDSYTLAQRVAEKISSPIMLPSKEKVTVGASIGVARFPEDGTTPDELIHAADEAMYKIKATVKDVQKRGSTDKADEVLEMIQ